MRVHILKYKETGENAAFHPGWVHELPDDEARGLIAEGVAEAASPDRQSYFYNQPDVVLPHALDSYVENMNALVLKLQREVSVLRYHNEELQDQIKELSR